MTPALDAFPDLVHEIVNYVEDQEISAWELRIRGMHTERLVSSPIGDLNSMRKAIEPARRGLRNFSGRPDGLVQKLLLASADHVATRNARGSDATLLHLGLAIN